MNEQNEFGTPSQPHPMPDEGVNGTSSEAQPIAYCQSCGRGLTEQSARVVGQSVFCEPCLEARIAGAAGVAGAAGAAGAAGQPPPSSAGQAYARDFYGAGWTPGPAGSTPGMANGPNPGLATLLGFIPGVGAMYNEQYAKGIVHLMVFAVLVTASDSFGIFGLFVAGWEFYMAIDANHTARARRDGLPLPNPFGLNDIGERFGFGKAWPGNPNVAAAAEQAARSAAQQATQAMRDAAAFASQASSRVPAQPAAPRPVTPYNQPNPYDPLNPYNQTQNWSSTYTGSVPTTYSTPYPDGSVPVAPPRITPMSRFPSGAIWLIGLGLLFLLTTTELFDRIRPHAVLGLGLIGLGGWIFTRRLGESGLTLQGDGSAAYRYRLFRALRVPVWLGVIGLWFLLDAFRWLPLHHTWPLLLIAAGVTALMDRLLFNAAQAESFPTAPAAPAAPSAPSVGPAGPAGNGDWSPGPESSATSAAREGLSRDVTKGGL